VGALRALSEYGCAFDFAGGTSMGAVIAAGVALGWSIEEIDRRIRAAFVRSNPLSDYRLPVVALLKGRRVEERLQEHFGDILIEDMALPFFCVSSNLSQGSAHIHTAGSLRQSLRASISLPGILPPVVRDRQVLVDGAVLNNFPVDIMRDMHRGRNIGVDAAQAPQALRADDFENPIGFFAWTARNGFSAPPPIANLLMRAATVGAGARVNTDSLDLLITPKLEGIELRDWKSYDEAVEAGYVATLRALEGAGEALRADLMTNPPKETARAAHL
jgi:NTE family protein